MKLDKKYQRLIRSYIYSIIPFSIHQDEVRLKVIQRFSHLPKQELITLVDNLFNRRIALEDPIEFPWWEQRINRGGVKNPVFNPNYGQPVPKNYFKGGSYEFP